jgi:hypothetical protein
MNSFESNLKSGMWVKATGFILNPEWNGMSGVLREQLQDKGLWVVDFPALAESREHATFRLKPTNLVPLEEQSVRNFPLATDSWVMVCQSGNSDWDGRAGVITRQASENVWVVQMQDGETYKIQSKLLLSVVPTSRRIQRKVIAPVQRVSFAWMKGEDLSSASTASGRSSVGSQIMESLFGF